ncbi:condensation protein [Kitasatospora sp. NPDC058218]|uniref:condensation protein n=1 Tax=Kitasatospora sp. NPDC058218 TaxID=3346385 RepID=UPI0036DEAD07
MLRLRAADRGMLAGPGGQPMPAVLLLDFAGPPPTVDDLCERVAERAARLPALHYRPSGNGRTARWSGQLDPGRHVRVVAAGVVAADHAAANDPGAELVLAQGPPPRDERPPWELLLITRPTGGYSLGFHGDHGLYDGALTIALLRALIDDRPAAGAPLPRPCRPRLTGITDTLAQQAALWRAPGPAPAFTAPAAGPRQVRHADAPLSRLRDLARAHRVSVNDVHLAALTHAVHLWNRGQPGETHPPLATGVPVSYRRPGEETTVGNRIALARVVLPCDEASPLQALRRVAEQTGRQKQVRQRDALRVLSALTPGAAAVHFVGRLSHALTASNIAVGGALTHRGDMALAAYGLTDAPGPGQCYTCLTSYQDTVRLTVVHQPGAPIGTDLPRFWLAALQALEHPLTGASDGDSAPVGGTAQRTPAPSR